MFDANFIDAQHQADQTFTSILLPLLRPRTVRIYAAFDLGQALLVLVDHSQYAHDAADENGSDRNQEDSQTEKPLKDFVHPRLRKTTTIGQRPTTDFLVELTGIEPVASWLQTRRSPS
jgi:hypothetical protein